MITLDTDLGTVFATDEQLLAAVRAVLFTAEQERRVPQDLAEAVSWDAITWDIQCSAARS